MFLALTSEAASVIWNAFDSYTHEPEVYSGGTYEQKECLNIYYYGRATPEVCLAYDKSRTGRYLSATAIWDYVNVGNPCAIWVLASAGDLLTSIQDFQSHQLIFDCLTDFDFETSSTGTISLSNQTQSYYLAIIGDAGHDYGTKNPYWGWVELEGNRAEGLSIVASALSFDAPLIVGGGFAAIPEPTSGLLLLIGSAMLLIRRPRS